VKAHLWWIVPAAFAVAALAAPAAGAHGGHGGLGGLLGGRSCASGGTQVFSSWGDDGYYNSAPNGGFESGSTGWTLRGGAQVVSGNEPFLRTGGHSLSLPSGSSATTPVICLGRNDPYIRFFGSDAGGTDAGLHVRVVWYGLLNIVLGVTDVNTYGGGGGWNPLDRLRSSGGGDVLIPLLGSTSARVEFTPVGSGSRWQLDDVYVDPRIARIG
jgi:hypothetical protein